MQKQSCLQEMGAVYPLNKELTIRKIRKRPVMEMSEKKKKQKTKERGNLGNI